MKNIIQMEFFHIGGTGNLHKLRAEAAGRIADGAPLKTAIRFFDEGGFVTGFALQRSNAQKRAKQLLAAAREARGFRKLVLTLSCDLAFATLSKAGTQLAFAQESFEAIMHTSREIAIELPNRSFRPLRDDEFYDLQTAIKKAKNAWIFVFSPNDLCAERNTVIAHVM